LAIRGISYTFVIFPDQLESLRERAEKDRTTMSALLRNILTKEQEDYDRTQSQSKVVARNASKSR
jgi:hypothetical protein